MKVALVTGGARGIGRACAIELARRGADIALMDVAAAEEAAALIGTLGRKATCLRCDVADSDAVRAMVDGLDRIDIVVNNAGFGRRASFLDAQVEEARRIFDVTFWGAFQVSQCAARRMIRQGTGGSIVMISSVHAVRPYVHASVYNSAKAALNHLAGTLANELAPYRIRVNTIEPGWIDTPGEREKFGDSFVEQEGGTLPLGRIGRPEEIGRAAAFLASDEASYITGACLRVDGGWVLAK